MGGARYWLIVAPLAACTALPAPAADGIDDSGLQLDQAMSLGRFFGELRPRYNRIDESDKPLLTDAFTLRATLGWKSGAWKGIRLTLEGSAFDIPSGATIDLVAEPLSLGKVAIPVYVRFE